MKRDTVSASALVEALRSFWRSSRAGKKIDCYASVSAPHSCGHSGGSEELTAVIVPPIAVNATMLAKGNRFEVSEEAK